MEQNFEAAAVLSELEESHDANDAEELEVSHVTVLAQNDVHIESESCHQVNDVDGGLEEFHSVGAGEEANEDLDGEPNVAHRLDGSEGLVRLGSMLLHADPLSEVAAWLDVVVGDVAAEAGGVGGALVEGEFGAVDDGHAEAGMRLEGEGEDGNGEEEDGDDGDDLGKYG